MIIYNKLIKDLREIGIQKGMVLMVHSSYKSIGYNEITPELIIRAIQEVITEEGTLLMPTLTYKTVSKDNPIFSYNETKSNVGIITEVFRKEENVYRSLNPIHSVAAWGKYAKELTDGSIKDSNTLGENSPFNLMLKYDAKILMLGCGLKPNTFMHLIENKNKIPYREIKYTIDFTLYDQDNKKINKYFDLPNMSEYDQRYDRIENILSSKYLINKQILNANSYLIDANQLLIEASRVLKDEPYYFVDKIV